MSDKTVKSMKLLHPSEFPQGETTNKIEVQHIKELPEIMKLDGAINTCVQETNWGTYKEIQKLFWLAVEAINNVVQLLQSKLQVEKNIHQITLDVSKKKSEKIIELEFKNAELESALQAETFAHDLTKVELQEKELELDEISENVVRTSQMLHDSRVENDRLREEVEKYVGISGVVFKLHEEKKELEKEIERLKEKLNNKIIKP